MRKRIRIIDGVLALLCTVIMSFVAYGSYNLPSEIICYENDGGTISSVFSYGESPRVSAVDSLSSSQLSKTLSAFGIFPVKEIRVKAETAPKVYVSGEVFGIKLYTDGVIVVGTQSVEAENSAKVNPAEKAGIETGDIIVSVNNIKVYSSGEVTALLNENNGESYTLRVKRGERYKTFVLTPVYSPREGCYKAGMWVRDSTAGIGTLTFYNEKYGTFASLGHQINDVDTNELMPLLEGEAVGASVDRVQKASPGATGSLWCTFEDYTIGRLLDNTPSGLYGAFVQLSDKAELRPVASKQEVHRGSAQLISTVKGSQPVAYDIEITRLTYNREAQQKDIVFRITDKKLLAETGGIVQGMSGSPIIQDGKLAGAVTHVIVSNPEKGYGIFAQTMYEKTKNLN
ncbi:MAG: SpoIVB peptidase [Eubacterium sp.]|nr:SpoIVB peptidase [Eubacterium sp.]